jgi:excisionase family DNA binding protein
LLHEATYCTFSKITFHPEIFRIPGSKVPIVQHAASQNHSQPTKATCSNSQNRTKNFQQMSSNIQIQKTCQHCGKRFLARTTVTKYCSDVCAKRAYKLRLRTQSVEQTIKKDIEENILSKEKVQKEYLSIDEACGLIGVSRWTIYRLIEKGIFKSAKIGARVIIPRVEIDRLFK